jgi:AcrR family transcriptional regulator
MEDIKEKIVQTAYNQFLANGIRKMPVQKLVAPMGISTKTVYKYFKNKEDLLEEVLRVYFDRQYHLFEQVSEKKTAVELLFEIWYQAVKREYSVNNAFFNDLHYYYPELEEKAEREIAQKFWQQILLVVRKGIDEGIFRKEIQPEIVLEGIAILYGQITRTDRFKQFNNVPYEIFANTIVPVIRGICTTEGLHQLDKCIETKTAF